MLALSRILRTRLLRRTCSHAENVAPATDSQPRTTPHATVKLELETAWPGGFQLCFTVGAPEMLYFPTTLAALEGEADGGDVLPQYMMFGDVSSKGCSGACVKKFLGQAKKENRAAVARARGSCV